jgi:hypothetical protein
LSLLGYNTTQGMREYVVIYGNARVTEGGAVPLLLRLAPLSRTKGDLSASLHAKHRGLCHQDHASTLLRDWPVSSTSHWLTVPLDTQEDGPISSGQRYA